VGFILCFILFRCFQIFSVVLIFFAVMSKKDGAGRLFYIVRREKLNEVIRHSMLGDSAAQEELCRMYAKTILFQSRLLVKNKSDAEDVAQKVMIEMIRGITSLKSPFAFRSWLQRIVVNAAYRQNMQTKKEYERSDVLDKAEFVIDDNVNDRPAEVVESKDLSQYIQGYLDKLPPTQAIVLVLYYYEDQSYKEIAATLGVSIGSVSSTMSKARKNLKELLKDSLASGSLGIVYKPLLPRRSLRSIVLSEVNRAGSDAAVERLMHTAKIAIAAGTISAGVVGASIAAGTAVAAGTGVAVGGGAAAKAASGEATRQLLGNIGVTMSGVTLLAAIAVGAFFVFNQPEAPETVPVNHETAPPVDITPEAPLFAQPDVDVVYSINEAAANTDNGSGSEVALDPLTSKIVANNGETLDYWVLTNAQEEPVASGTEMEVDIVSLNLNSGQYLLTWHMLNSDGLGFIATWEFAIS
jgi:RNA polymerase sigma-70 factor (ECF subfamily)